MAPAKRGGNAKAKKPAATENDSTTMSSSNDEDQAITHPSTTDSNTKSPDTNDKNQDPTTESDDPPQKTSDSTAEDSAKSLTDENVAPKDGKKRKAADEDSPSTSDKDSAKPGSAKKPKKSSSSDKTLRLLAWNVAGLRAWLKKSGADAVKRLNPDLVFFGETKTNELPTAEEKQFRDFPHKYFAKSAKAGYSGVALFTKIKPISVKYKLGDARFDAEGRLIIAEFDEFYFVGTYVPNSGRGLTRLGERAEWDSLFAEKLAELDQSKPVILTGDLNVAHMEIDLRNPDSNRNKTAGFTDQERNAFTSLLGRGFVDVWRQRNKGVEHKYTFWSYMGGARAKNVGWRLDYFVLSNRIVEKVTDCEIHDSELGSDHCPVTLDIDL